LNAIKPQQRQDKGCQFVRCNFTVTLVALLLLLPLNTSAKVMLGAYLPGEGWNVEEINRFNDATDKQLAFVTIFSAFSHNWNEHLKWQSTNIYNNGAIPLISWMPVDVDDGERNLLPEIINGQWDDYIDNWTTGLLAWVNSYPDSKIPVILLRFGHEFNGNWYPYSGEPELFVRAWQHLHKRFEHAGANDYVEWVWNSNHISYDNHNDITLYYPGDEHVDWTAIDGYNWGTNHDWTTWDSFEDIFAAAYQTLITNYPTKPVLIAEYGTAEPDDTPSKHWGQFGNDQDRTKNRAEWFAEMLSSIELHFPAIRGISLFNHNKELSWSLVKSNSTGLTAYNRGIQSDYFTTSFLCARVMPGRSTSVDTGPQNIQRGSIVPLQLELINPDVFSHAISTRSPPPDAISTAETKSQHYRSKVRSMSEDQRQSLARRRLEVLEY